MNGDTIVAGIGQTEFSKESGRSELQLAAEASRAAILDAGLTPADIDGMVTFTIDSSGELDLMRALGIQEVRCTGRARPTEARARTPPCSTRRSRSPPARRTPCSCTAPSTSGRAGASVNPCRSPAPAHARLVLHVRDPHAGADVLALVPSLHGRVRRDQRRLRPLHGRRPPSRGDQPERVVLPAADHARRPPAVALDRRAGAAPARLLSGERRGSGARRHHVPTARATFRNRRCASKPPPTPISATGA